MIQLQDNIITRQTGTYQLSLVFIPVITQIKLRLFTASTDCQIIVL